VDRFDVSYMCQYSLLFGNKMSSHNLLHDAYEMYVNRGMYSFRQAETLFSDGCNEGVAKFLNPFYRNYSLIALLIITEHLDYVCFYTTLCVIQRLLMPV
jgi:hypothetical protein